MYIIYKKDTEGEYIYWSEINEDWITDERLASRYNQKAAKLITSQVGGYLRLINTQRHF